MYNTVEQIKAAFVKDGWSSDIEFEELTRREKILPYAVNREYL